MEEVAVITSSLFSSVANVKEETTAAPDGRGFRLGEGDVEEREAVGEGEPDSSHGRRDRDGVAANGEVLLVLVGVSIGVFEDVTREDSKEVCPGEKVVRGRGFFGDLGDRPAASPLLRLGEMELAVMERSRDRFLFFFRSAKKKGHYRSMDSAQ